MRMDKKTDGGGGADSPPRNGAPPPPDVLDELLDAFRPRNGGDARAPLPDLARVEASVPDVVAVDGIDPSSPLGRSLRVKFTELEEISRRLKSRLDRVVNDQEILLSPDAPDPDLERDLNTDSRAEDLTPQEFSRLLQNAAPSKPDVAPN